MKGARRCGTISAEVCGPRGKVRRSGRIDVTIAKSQSLGRSEAEYYEPFAASNRLMRT